MKRSLPWIVITIFLVYVAAAIVRPAKSAGGFNADAFGRLPVWLNGRVQPIDSAARIALLQIRGTATVPVPEDAGGPSHLWTRPPRLGATEWLLETLTKPAVADVRKIFVISFLTLAFGLCPSRASLLSSIRLRDRRTVPVASIMRRRQEGRVQRWMAERRKVEGPAFQPLFSCALASSSSSGSVCESDRQASVMLCP
jgi:hypothetical protein